MLFQIVIRDLGPNGDELIWFGKWKRMEQDGIDNAEDGAIGADAERKGENGDNSEPGCFCQHPQRESEISDHISLRSFRSQRNYGIDPAGAARG